MTNKLMREVKYLATNLLDIQFSTDSILVNFVKPIDLQLCGLKICRTLTVSFFELFWAPHRIQSFLSRFIRRPDPRYLVEILILLGYHLSTISVSSSPSSLLHSSKLLSHVCPLQCLQFYFTTISRQRNFDEMSRTDF